MKIIIIIPTYNESLNIGELIRDIFKLNIPDLEILVVDDNSPDGTGRLVEDLKNSDSRIHLIKREKKMGLGTAYLEGFKYALVQGAEYIFQMDSDFSHDPKSIPSFLEAVKDCDTVFGSKYVSGGKMKIDFFRNILSHSGNLFAKFILGTPFNDLTGGYRCYRRAVLEAIDFSKVEASNYSFQIEMAYKVFKKGFKIKEIPIIFTVRELGKSKFQLKMILEALETVFKLKFKILPV